jgi:hypothetical protein
MWVAPHFQGYACACFRPPLWPPSPLAPCQRYIKQVQGMPGCRNGAALSFEGHEGEPTLTHQKLLHK